MTVGLVVAVLVVVAAVAVLVLVGTVRGRARRFALAAAALRADTAAGLDRLQALRAQRRPARRPARGGRHRRIGPET